jgi:hypothetical protein
VQPATADYAPLGRFAPMCQGGTEPCVYVSSRQDDGTR